MNSLMPSLQAVGTGWASLAGPMLLQSSLLIGVLLLADLALRRRARAVFRHALWLLVLVKLVLPTSLSLPWISTGYWLPVSPATAVQAPLADQWRVAYGSAAPESAAGMTATPIELTASATAWRPAGMLFAGWLAGMAALGGYVARQGWRARRLVRAARPACAEVEQRLEACRRQTGLRRSVGVRLSPSIGSPAVCGLVRPVILLPADLPDQLAPEALDAVLLHELTHLRRGDGWWHWLQTILQVGYWWHPLVWFANAHIRRLREQAVDEQVMALLGRAGGVYAETLVQVARLASARPASALGMVGILESPSALKERVQRLLAHSPTGTGRLGFVNLLAIAAAGCVLLPMAGSSTNDPATEPASGTIVPPVTAEAAAPAATKPLVLEVSGQPARFTLDGEAVKAEDLAARLRACRTNDPEAVLSLRADQEVPMQAVQQAIAAATDAGITRLSLRTVPAAGQGAPAIGATPENAGQTPVPGAVATVTGVMDVEMMKRYGLLSLRAAPAAGPATTVTGAMDAEMMKRYGLSQPPSAPTAQTSFYKYQVKQGDTLSSIAKAYTDSGRPVTPEQVQAANPKLDPAKLRVGQALLIPQAAAATGAVTTASISMDPELMKRYGLTPAGTNAAPGMSPVMAKRYGLATPPQTESRALYNLPEEMRRRYGLMPAVGRTNAPPQAGGGTVRAGGIGAGASMAGLGGGGFGGGGGGFISQTNGTPPTAAGVTMGAGGMGGGTAMGMGGGGGGFGGGSSGGGGGQLNRVAASSAPIPPVAAGMGHAGASAAGSGEDAVTVSAAFYAIPAAEVAGLLKDLNAGEGTATEARPGRAWTLDPEQTRRMTAQLKEAKSAQLLGRPRITTLSGQEAMIMSGADPQPNGTPTPRLAMRVSARAKGEATDLTLAVGSVPAPASQTTSPAVAPANATMGLTASAGSAGLMPVDPLYQTQARLVHEASVVIVSDEAALPDGERLLVLVQIQ